VSSTLSAFSSSLDFILLMKSFSSMFCSWPKSMCGGNVSVYGYAINSFRIIKRFSLFLLSNSASQTLCLITVSVWLGTMSPDAFRFACLRLLSNSCFFFSVFCFLSL
jgi:hypothetical protein